MSLFSRNNLNKPGQHVDPLSWEKHILNQQGAYSRKSRNVRRYTVDDIQAFEDFEAGWHERQAKKAAMKQGGPVHEPELSRSNSPEPCMFDFSDFTDDLPGSKKSSFNSSRAKHQFGSFRNSTFAVSPRYSPYNSPKQRRRFTAGDNHHHHHHTSGSTDSFEESVRHDKARFQQNQQHSRRPRPKPSALPKREQFLNTPQPFGRKYPSAANLRSTTNLYHQWYEECTAKLQDKGAMASIPPPPIPACGTCQQKAVIGCTEIPITCIHSMETLLRGATKGPGCNPHDGTAYVKILKEERNRWHTDRFGACKAEHKAEIEGTAQQLFVLINELFVKEKARLDRYSVAKTWASPTPGTGQNSGNKTFFGEEETRVW